MPLNQIDKRYYLALSLISGLGPKRIKQLLTACDDEVSRLFNQPQLARQAGMNETIVEQLRDVDWQIVDDTLRWAEHERHHIIYYDDPVYPPLLREINAPPFLFYLAGDIDILRLPQLAIVGSRTPSVSGRDTAYQFADFLSQHGLGICSGLALGIDTAAHSGALAHDGITLAVLGSGLQQIYPAKNRKLFEQITVNGAVISEFPLNMGPKAQHFPRRNRIISGLAVGCLVVEAAVQSGSLITARYAMEQGREVFAIPGSIHNPLARGCHRLIRDGAKLVETGQDILSELQTLINVDHSTAINQPPINPTSSARPPLDPSYETLLTALDYDATAIDTLVQRTHIPSHEIASMLVILELDGMIRSVPGGYAKL